jgi:L-lysine exporter family protein LysE/ArgO
MSWSYDLRAVSVTAVSALLAGLGLGFSLIIAIGAQNVFVLRQGIRREYVGLVAGICTFSDAVLIVVGISGIGVATQVLPWLVPVIRWAGAIFLIGYGMLAARRAIRPATTGLEAGAEAESVPGRGAAATSRPRLTSVVLTTLALTWLNPHVYLDTVFLLGSVGASHGAARWVFAAGAMTASATWFFGLAYGARFLSGWLAGPRAWRILDAGIAMVMITLGVSLVWPSS